MAKPGFDIRILGSRRLQKKLNKLERRVQGRIMREAAKDAMKPVVQVAKQRAPVETGKTQKYIKAAAYSSRNGVGAMVRTGTRRQMGIEPDDPFYYPAAHEYGTSKMPARPFMRSALADRRRQVLRLFRVNIARLLKRP